MTPEGCETGSGEPRSALSEIAGRFASARPELTVAAARMMLVGETDTGRPSIGPR